MATPTKITVYDAETKLKEKTLSPFTIRVRLMLDYKNVSYDMVWVQFHEIEATAKAIGASPTRTKADGSPGYTIPFATFAFSNKPTVVLSDSATIAHFIEETYPDPDGKLLPADTRVFQSVFSKYVTENIYMPLPKITLPLVIRACSERAQEWIIQSRKSVVGKTVEEFAPQDEASIAEAWKLIEAGFDDFASHFDKAGEGNFRITGDASYAEFELVSLLNMVKRLDPGAWERLGARNGGRWAKLMDLPLYQKLLPANHV